MRILYICGGDPNYIRNLMLRRALRRSFDLVEVWGPPPHYLTMHLAAAWRYLRADRRNIDLVVVGFMGHLLVPWVRRWTRAPILFDPYVSVYDTLCLDRRRFSPHSPVGRLAHALDRLSCRLADRLLMDTRAHRDFFVRTFGLPEGRCEVVYVGCDEQQFAPPPAVALAEQPSRAWGGQFQVFTYSSFLRLHGVEHILRAAQRLQAQRDVVFVVGGAGPGLGEMQRLARDLELTNVQFPGWIPFEELPGRIAGASLCLGGHFSGVEKASRVIPTKTFQFLAMAKPVIAGDNPANRELLIHLEHAVLCPMADPVALAEAIQMLYRDAELRSRIASNGARLFREQLSLSVQAARLRDIVGRALG